LKDGLLGDRVSFRIDVVLILTCYIVHVLLPIGSSNPFL
jgi:hypothetical protein